MTIIVSAFNPPPVPVPPTDSDKPPELDNNDLKPKESASPKSNDPPQIATRYTVVKEFRDWVNSTLLGMTLTVGLIMTFLTLSRSDIKEITKALSSNDANLKEVIAALVKNNDQIALTIKQNNETVQGAINENTKHLREVIKILDIDGNGELSENEVKRARDLLVEAEKWKRFTDAINEATKKK